MKRLGVTKGKNSVNCVIKQNRMHFITSQTIEKRHHFQQTHPASPNLQVSERFRRTFIRNSFWPFTVCSKSHLWINFSVQFLHKNVVHLSAHRHSESAFTDGLVEIFPLDVLPDMNQYFMQAGDRHRSKSWFPTHQP